MRYDLATAQTNRRRSTLAREKNTSRAEARRRSREQMRAQLVAEAAEEEAQLEDDAAPESSEPERKPLFRMPNIREDLRALPSILGSRRILLLPLALLVIGFLGVLVYPGLSADLQVFAGYYVQFFFAPPALFTFFLAGFFAPRASYLVGATYGLVAGVFWAVAFAWLSVVVAPPTPDQPVQSTDPVMGTVVALAYGLLYGTLAAALAAWYRDFLRGIQERGKQRRAEREVDERARRREERQEARKLAKQRPTS